MQSLRESIKSLKTNKVGGYKISQKLKAFIYINNSQLEDKLEEKAPSIIFIFIKFIDVMLGNKII